MPVTLEDVARVADLAKLTFSEEEKRQLVKELNRILEYMERLNELDTTEVSPTSHVIPIKNVFREDQVAPSLSREELLANAPSRDEAYFRIPKVIE